MIGRLLDAIPVRAVRWLAIGCGIGGALRAIPEGNYEVAIWALIFALSALLCWGPGSDR